MSAIIVSLTSPYGSCVCFHPWPPGFLTIQAVSGMGSPLVIQASCWPVISWPWHNCCVTFIPAHLVDRINCRSKLFWLCWCPSITLDVLPGYRRRLFSLSIPCNVDTLLGTPSNFPRTFFCNRFPHCYPNAPTLVISVHSPFITPLSCYSPCSQPHQPCPSA